MKTPGEILVNIVIDTSRFEEQMRKIKDTLRSLPVDLDEHRRRSALFMYRIETLGKSADQVYALYYVRGGMDSRYETPAARDAYADVLANSGLPHSYAAATAFLRGWFTHRGRASQ